MEIKIPPSAVLLGQKPSNLFHVFGYMYRKVCIGQVFVSFDGFYCTLVQHRSYSVTDTFKVWIIFIKQSYETNI